MAHFFNNLQMDIPVFTDQKKYDKNYKTWEVGKRHYSNKKREFDVVVQGNIYSVTSNFLNHILS